MPLYYAIVLVGRTVVGSGEEIGQLRSCRFAILPAERFQAECAAGILRAGRSAKLLHAGGAGADHPVHPMLPETAYLKALVYTLN